MHDRHDVRDEQCGAEALAGDITREEEDAPVFEALDVVEVSTYLTARLLFEVSGIHPAAMLIIVAASMFALRQILSRVLSDTDRTMTTVAYTALVGSFLLSLLLPFVWRWPATGTEMTLLVSIAVLAAFAELLVIKALEVAQAVVVAPVQYTMLIWGTVYGYLVFAQLPDLWTWVGALIIVVTGFYTLHRERAALRRRRRA